MRKRYPKKNFWASKIGLGHYVEWDNGERCEWYAVVKGYGHVSENGRAYWSTKEEAMQVARRWFEKEINAKITQNGGWAKEQLAEWGVAWPPKAGWKKELIDG